MKAWESATVFINLVGWKSYHVCWFCFYVLVRLLKPRLRTTCAQPGAWAQAPPAGVQPQKTPSFVVTGFCGVCWWCSWVIPGLASQHGVISGLLSITVAALNTLVKTTVLLILIFPLPEKQCNFILCIPLNISLSKQYELRVCHTPRARTGFVFPARGASDWASVCLPGKHPMGWGRLSEGPGVKLLAPDLGVRLS